MGVPRVIFRVCETLNCPKFQYGDSFTVSGVAVMMRTNGDSSFVSSAAVHANQSRENCEILYGDFVKIIIKYERADQIPDCLISCSGCIGSLRLEHLKNRKTGPEQEALLNSNKEIAALLEELGRFPFFQIISHESLAELLRNAELEAFKKDDIIIRQGEAGSKLYIVAEGKVNILNDTGISISTLEQGEIFGEMSLICDENIGATVQAAADCKILSVHHGHFQRVLDRYPAMQRYFTKLMAQRLSRSNKIRFDDYASGMIGRLEEIPPEALFQTLHTNGKTGILTITEVAKGTARFSLRQGALIKASYAGQKGKEAFFRILREKKGRFKFNPGLPKEDFDVPEIGYFMKLLMEGLQQIDEDRSARKQRQSAQSGEEDEGGPTSP
ncbi:cyclic nucleotide-binding domain-containing protein [Candidatus Electronema sp. JM]|uniref:cyclic nucleotide-binding domain-containing protein n=1 Tax=Candidatus Electronema sp. JM TaxID=3401571 RepID=UPI003AA99F1E